MLKLNRITEYGLIALRHIGRKPDEPSSAREISDEYGLPFEITAKTLLRLRDIGFLQSAQGARGGYTLLPGLERTSLADFVSKMEGPLGVVDCVSNQACQCDYQARCGLTGVMGELNERMNTFLAGISLSELVFDSTRNG